MVSNIGISTRWPRPVRSRCTRLAQIAPDRRQTDDTIDQCIGDVARNAIAGLRHQGRQCGRALDQIVISGLGRIGTVLAEAEHAGINQARIDPGDDIVAELKPRHCLGSHIVDQHIGGCDQAEDHVAARGLFQVERD
jgi:hypothetical protein